MVKSLKGRISRNLQNAIGRRTKRKILVIESDDWGSIRMPSMQAYQKLFNAGIAVNKCPYNTFDSLESVEDIETIRDFCKGFKDKNGNHLKITANFIMANPDFEKIKESIFNAYHYKDLKKTYQYYQGSVNTLAALKNAMIEKAIVPQLHGREHLQVNYWLKVLKTGDNETLTAFNNGVWGHPSEYELQSGINFSSAFHITSQEDYKFANESVIEASKLFNETFGFISETFISPRFIWPKSLESTFYNAGIRAVQGKLVQLYPIIGSDDVKLHRKINWMGKPNQAGLKYLIRNVFFEPTQKPGFPWEKDALKRIGAAFFWGKPAVISTHRLNFMGGFSEQNRKDSLNRLLKLIKVVQNKYPDVEFMSSNELYHLVYEK